MSLLSRTFAAACLLIAVASPLTAQRRTAAEVTSPLVAERVSIDPDSLRPLYLVRGAPLIIIEDVVYFPKCVCDAGWCQRSLGGATEARLTGGDTEGRQLGGQSEGRNIGGGGEQRIIGGGAEARQVGGQSEGRQVGGQSEGRRLGGQSEGRLGGGQGEQRQIGGQTENRLGGGGAEGRLTGGQSENRQIGGGGEARSGGGEVSAFSCAVQRSQYGRLTLRGVRPELRISVFDGRALRSLKKGELVVDF